MDSESIKEKIKERQKSRNLPYSLTFELSPLCNFDCKMCYIHRNLQENEKIKTADEWIDIAKEAFEAGVLSIALTGGEVFLYPRFRELYEAIYDMGFYVIILTNAYLIDDTVIEWLSKRKPYYLKTTIYGASNETYQKVCGVRDGFDRVTENILKLKNAGINVTTTMTVIQENVADRPKVKEWAKEHDFSLFAGEGIRQPVRGAERDINAVRVPLKFDTNNLVPLKEKRRIYPYINGQPFSCCKSYRNHVYITWKGDILGCTFVTSISESYSKGNFVSSYRRLWDRLDQIKQPSKCDTCEYLEWCNPCPGTIEGEAGCQSVVSEYVCNFAKYNYYAMNYTRENPIEMEDNTIRCEPRDEN